MDEKLILSKVKKIKNKFRLINIIAAILVISVYFYVPINVAYKLIVILAVIILAFYLKTKVRLAVTDILYNDCDPQTYYAVCHGIYMDGTTAFIDAQVAYFIGDFKSAAGIIFSQLKLKQRKTVKIQYLDLLANVAFFSGDFELCQSTCEEVKELLQELRGRTAVKESYYVKYDFFQNFINCDYVGALKNVERRKGVAVKKQKNSYKLIMHYYTAITLYYSNKSQEAKAEFEKIISASPKFFILDKAEAYIKSIDEDSFLPVDSVSLKEIRENAGAPMQNIIIKKEKNKRIIIAILLIVIGIVLISKTPGAQNGTAYDVISVDKQVSEVFGTIPIDDDYSLCIFATPYDEIGVAYLKNHGEDRYSYYLSRSTMHYSFLKPNNVYYIDAIGKAPRVYYDITDDKTEIPEDRNVTEFTFNDNTYYFYIIKTETEYHFFNSSGTN